MNKCLTLAGRLLGLVMFLQVTGANATPKGDSLMFTFSGRFLLNSEPCQLGPRTSEIPVYLQGVDVQDLYSMTRTQGAPFVINLVECDTSLANEVVVTFSGTESTGLPGTLAVTGEAKGIAIGIEEPDGTPVPLNKPTPGFSLVDNDNSIGFLAYVTAEPDALSDKTITAGDFTATATFELTYP